MMNIILTLKEIIDIKLLIWKSIISTEEMLYISIKVFYSSIAQK